MPCISCGCGFTGCGAESVSMNCLLVVCAAVLVVAAAEALLSPAYPAVSLPDMVSGSYEVIWLVRAASSYIIPQYIAA